MSTVPDWGPLLRRIRHQRQKPMSWVAEQLGVGEEYISRLERGKRTLGTHILNPWLEALGVEIQVRLLIREADCPYCGALRDPIEGEEVA
ncbi:MAG TPA: helix-turn-helix transcriptional regulator [Dehalococcoidia bacterium]|nr:helix-turn-helix transcriptional regulator [Dehalococcoidia bacterium]